MKLLVHVHVHVHVIDVNMSVIVYKPNCKIAELTVLTYTVYNTSL